MATPTKLLCQDDCAPDAFESFERDFPSKSGGLTFDEFKERATREDYDRHGHPCEPADGFTTEWRLGCLTLTISADDPYYELIQDDRPREGEKKAANDCGRPSSVERREFERIARYHGMRLEERLAATVAAYMARRNIERRRQKPVL
jgi:hypothetical protein